MENKYNYEVIFLAKLQLVVNTLNEIDDLCDNLYQDRQNTEFELSDLLHLLQNEDLNDEQMLNISKKIKDIRLKRLSLKRLEDLIGTYKDNKQKLIGEQNRPFFMSNIQKTRSHLYEDYKYRIMTEQEINELKKIDNKMNIKKNESDTHKRGRKVSISKEELEECLTNNMTVKAISSKYHTTEATVIKLKHKYGFKVKTYNKGK